MHAYRGYGSSSGGKKRIIKKRHERRKKGNRRFFVIFFHRRIITEEVVGAGRGRWRCFRSGDLETRTETERNSKKGVKGRDEQKNVERERERDIKMNPMIPSLL